MACLEEKIPLRKAHKRCKLVSAQWHDIINCNGKSLESFKMIVLWSDIHCRVLLGWRMQEVRAAGVSSVK